MHSRSHHSTEGFTTVSRWSYKAKLALHNCPNTGCKYANSAIFYVDSHGAVRLATTLIDCLDRPVSQNDVRAAF